LQKIDKKSPLIKPPPSPSFLKRGAKIRNKNEIY